MSVQAISWVIENSKHKSGDLVVLLMIANHAHSDGTGSFPGNELLARESRMTRRQVQRCIRRLEASGELHTALQAGKHGANMYDLPMMRGVKFTRVNGDSGGRNPRRKGATPTSPEPSLTVIKQPKPRVQSRDARNRFDEEIEQRRKIEAKARREAQEAEVWREVHVG